MEKNFDNILYITGGGGLSPKCINISTLAAILVSSLGVRVFKHISYSSNKKCSSALLLEELGIKVSRSLNEIEENFYSDGIVFIDAIPELILDNMCPFLAPPNKTVRFIGANNPENAMKYIFELRARKYLKTMIVSPYDNNYDEASICGNSQIFEYNAEKISNYIINPKDLGLTIAEDIHVTGATPVYNAGLAEKIFSNQLKDAKLDVIVLNAGIMLYILGITNSIKHGIIQAYKLVESSQAFNKFNNLRGNKN